MATLPGSAPSVGGRDLDLRYYAQVVWRGRILIATAALVGLVLGTLVAYLQTPEYQSGVMLQIDPPTPTFLNVTDALVGAGNFWQNADFYNTQFKVLRSKGIAEKVLDRLKLKDRLPFKGVPDPESILIGQLTIEPVPDTRLVQVQVIHQDPKEAALWANTIADVYIEQSLTSRVESARKAYDWLQERLANTQQNMRTAQDKLFRSYQGQDLFVPEGSVSAVTSSITKLNADFMEAQTRRISLEAALKQVAEMRKRGEGLEAVPQLATDSQILNLSGQLGALNVDLSRLREKYKEAHPEIQKVQAQVDQVQRAKALRAQQVIAGMSAEYEQIQKRENELKAAVDAQKAQAATQSRKGSELEALKKEADSSKNLYEVLLQKLNETDIAASIRSNNVTLIERASVPRFPVRPQKKRIAGAGLLMGLALGFGLVLLRDHLDNTIKDPDDIERFLHVDLLAAVPRYDEENVSLATEAYQNLRTALLFGRKDDSPQAVMVTGSVPQEGKTTTLLNLGKLLAASGDKVALLDFDLRRAQLHTRLGLSREPGLANFFLHQADIDNLVQPTSVPNLFVLTAGPLPPNPPALLTRKDIPGLLDHLRKHFDWMLMDSPPLASVTDGLLLARHADMVLFVVHYNRVDKRLVKRSLIALRKVTSNVLGVVLNAVDLKTGGYYYYYYHQDQADSAVPPKLGLKPVAMGRRK